MNMKLSLRAAVIAAAILSGGAILLVGLINFADPNYGTSFLQMTNSVYPWFHSTHSIGDVLGRAIAGALDGAIAGILFAWLYNCYIGSKSLTSKQ
jgi:hypothetical protein